MSECNKIICIGGFQMPDKNAAAHRVLNNAKALRNCGYETIFIDINMAAEQDIINTRKVYFGFETYSISNTKKRFIDIDCFKKVYSLYSHDVVGVIAYNYPALPLYQLKNFCKKNHIFLVGDVTEWYEATGINYLYKLIKKIDIDLRMKVIQPHLNGIIAISRYLEDYYATTTSVVRIPPLTDIDEKKWNVEIDKNNNTELKIIYAGSPGYNKDKLNKIIEGISNCNFERLKFTIIGITEEQFLNYYPEEKEILEKVGDHIIFTGRISHDLVIQKLKESDYTLFFRENTRLTKAGFPTKFAESITCGIPVITNNSSDLAEYITEGRNGFMLSTDNFLDELPNLLDQLISGAIKRPKVEREIFDYHNYQENLKIFIDKINRFKD